MKRLLKVIEDIEFQNGVISYSQIGDRFDPETIEIPTNLWHELVSACLSIKEDNDG